MPLPDQNSNSSLSHPTGGRESHKSPVDPSGIGSPRNRQGHDIALAAAGIPASHRLVSLPAVRAQRIKTIDGIAKTLLVDCYRAAGIHGTNGSDAHIQCGGRLALGFSEHGDLGTAQGAASRRNWTETGDARDRDRLILGQRPTRFRRTSGKCKGGLIVVFHCGFEPTRSPAGHLWWGWAAEPCRIGIHTFRIRFLPARWARVIG